MTKQKEEELIGDVGGLKSEMKHVSSQVSNHIPTQIKGIDKRLDKLEVRFALWGGIATGILAILQLISMFK